VAGPVIQATGRSEFEDGLGSGDFLPDCSYHMSDRTGLPDQTKQTKFQSQWPSVVKTPVPSILSTEVKQHRVCVHPISREKADQLLARRAGVVSHREAMIQIHALHTRLPKHCTHTPQMQACTRLHLRSGVLLTRRDIVVPG
jgi:hypothetical protein